jgi:phenylpyruvate tautomerase PptA (4-oxalocrotonate tautomerase family)
MKQTKHRVLTQLGLALESHQHNPLTEEIQDELIKALAELLLEAYGDDPSNEHWQWGGYDEPEADS